MRQPLGGARAAARRLAQRAHALAPARQQNRQRQRQGARAIKLGGALGVRTPGEAGGRIEPEPGRLRRLALALAHVKAIPARRAAPIHQPRAILGPLIAVLPERLALARAAAAMHARRAGGQALGVKQHARQITGNASAQRAFKHSAFRHYAARSASSIHQAADIEPSARAPNESCMRWPGSRASAATSSTAGARRPRSSARPHRQHQRLPPRGPGPQAMLFTR